MIVECKNCFCKYNNSTVNRCLVCYPIKRNKVNKRLREEKNKYGSINGFINQENRHMRKIGRCSKYRAKTKGATY